MSEPVGLYVTKSDYAYTRIREGILMGEFGPGSVLNQAMLARTIGVSTTPLREALRRLKSEGLVELDAHRDARVSTLTAEEARDLLEVRRSLDPSAAALAAERRTKDDIRIMREAALGRGTTVEQPDSRRPGGTSALSRSDLRLLPQRPADQHPGRPVGQGRQIPPSRA